MKYKKVLILAPHLDDAGLSVPALISHLVKLKKQILCATMFTISPYAPHLQTKNVKKISLARKNEDLSALKFLSPKIKSKHFDFLDAPLRGVKNVTGRNVIRREEEKIIKILEGFILKHTDSLIVAPLGVMHIDHLAVSESVLRLIENGRVKACRVMFYEELPISGTQPLTVVNARAKAIQKRLKIKMIKKYISTGNLLALKKIMTSFYPSQLGVPDINAVMKHTARLGNRERYWLLP